MNNGHKTTNMTKMTKSNPVCKCKQKCRFGYGLKLFRMPPTLLIILNKTPTIKDIGPTFLVGLDLLGDFASAYCIRYDDVCVGQAPEVHSPIQKRFYSAMEIH